MQRLTRRDLALSLHRAGRTVEEVARALKVHPPYVANVLAAEEVNAEGESTMSKPLPATFREWFCSMKPCDLEEVAGGIRMPDSLDNRFFEEGEVA